MSLLCGGGGDGAGAEELDPEEKKRNEMLAREANKIEEKQRSVIKMLLLGAGESGKSTIFKQMKVINKNGYTEKERKEFVGIVYSNIISSMKALMEAFEKLEVQMPDDLAKMNDTFQEAAESEKLTPATGELLKSMWMHEATKAMFGRRNEYQLNDSTQYYFEDITRLCQDGYIPSEQDVLRSRVRTTGIVQSDFTIKSIQFSMFDVGGQRNERRKWIHCFDNVQAVVFVASCSEFDQKLFEDETQNRLDEAIQLFDQICNSKWFKTTAMILFLNKKDLFEEKLAEKRFADYIVDYSGANELKPCCDHMKDLFLKKNKADKSVFVQITCATDTSNVKFVFNAVVAIILEENMKSSGLA
ncbi:hypothetical protein AB1Y20_022712 [Prymnesium parvum]|uniref:Uncharacterized protein n=1 Tax=Prymnesium parvum TaxID=97485 RepID=A0AB34JH07_PRYPA